MRNAKTQPTAPVVEKGRSALFDSLHPTERRRYEAAFTLVEAWFTFRRALLAPGGGFDGREFPPAVDRLRNKVRDAHDLQPDKVLSIATLIVRCSGVEIKFPDMGIGAFPHAIPLPDAQTAFRALLFMREVFDLTNFW